MSRERFVRAQLLWLALFAAIVFVAGSAAGANAEAPCKVALGPLVFEEEEPTANPRTLDLTITREGDCAELEAAQILFSPNWTQTGIVGFEYEFGPTSVAEFLGDETTAEWHVKKRTTAVFNPPVESAGERSSGYTASEAACRFRGNRNMTSCSSDSLSIAPRTVEVDPVMWSAP